MIVCGVANSGRVEGDRRRHPAGRWRRWIAWRSEPGPLSSVLLTTKLDRRVRSSMTSKRGRWRRPSATNPDGDCRLRRRRHGESVRDGEWLMMARLVRTTE